ncbi:hypothetical protein L7E55_08880 [Pelotomaculum isophthalicicum JI]|uniref:Uncharacterized protein n=1 Tax=Pelotomaculum isophthalicicum JI TaxID=947010 RepID=A0A9X4JU48_9FIRM|nr:hypothetical protein [Pelotomaculum isophthalicicum]MDF9408470.1 hypothetical protein [Pelotomaculum isophthalicicum JI]
MVKLKTKVFWEIREGMSPINSAPTAPQLVSDRTSAAAKAAIDLFIEIASKGNNHFILTTEY